MQLRSKLDPHYPTIVTLAVEDLWMLVISRNVSKIYLLIGRGVIAWGARV
jgi:hypothetical protein